MNLDGRDLVAFLRDVFLGLVIGVAAITPGLSGGAMAAAMGLYEPIIRALNNIFRTPKRSFHFLIPYALGAIVGVLAFSNAMEWLMQQAPNQVKALFLGLVAGSLPALLREANKKGFRLRYLLALLIALIVVYQAATFTAWPRPTGGQLNFAHFILLGVIYAVGSIVPGISSSFIFIHLGVYEDLLRAISTVNIAALFPAAIGFLLGAVFLVRAVEVLFRRFHSLAYYSVLGFLLGSALLILPPLSLGMQLFWDMVTFSFGVILSIQLLRLSARTSHKSR